MADRLEVHCEMVEHISVRDACRLCRVEYTFYQSLVSEGVFDPGTEHAALDATQLARLKRAARLHLDLGVNPPGIALVLELIERP